VYVCVRDRFKAREHFGWGGGSYLAGRDELQRAQRALQVGDVVLEVSQRLRRVSHVANQYGVRLALAMLVSISDGFCLEGLLGAIFFRDSDMAAAEELVEGTRLSACRGRSSRHDSHFSKCAKKRGR
jgi:hypothetical protein